MSVPLSMPRRRIWIATVARTFRVSRIVVPIGAAWHRWRAAAIEAVPRLLTLNRRCTRLSREITGGVRSTPTAAGATDITRVWLTLLPTPSAAVTTTRYVRRDSAPLSAHKLPAATPARATGRSAPMSRTSRQARIGSRRSRRPGPGVRPRRPPTTSRRGQRRPDASGGRQGSPGRAAGRGRCRRRWERAHPHARTRN